MQNQISVEELARKLKPLFGKKIDELYFRYMNASSEEEKGEIFQLLTSLYQKHLSQLLEKDFFLEPPKKENLGGEYPLGKVSYAGKKLFDFNLREKDWSRHVCITGMSGSGKTTFALNILNNFSKRNKPFLVFDWKKSFRPLMKTDPEVMCFTIGNDSVSNFFKTNINRPPKGVSPKEWISSLCDLLAESFNVSFGSHKILLETLDEAFEGWGVYNGSELYPNWEHIKRMLEIKTRNAKGRETGWYESALRIATILTFGDFGKVVNYDGKRSQSIEDLFDKKVIFEMNSLGNIEKKFFCEYILTYIYKLKKSSEKPLEDFNYAILVDEAHNIFLKKRTNFVTESVTDMIYREMREYGTCLVCLDQHASKLSDTVIGNSACHVAFQQQLPQDLDEISSLMQLRDKKEIFNQLPVGSVIVKLSERHTSPFLLEAPYVDLRDSSVSDEKVKGKMKFAVEVMDVDKNDPEFKDKLENPEGKTQKKVEDVHQKIVNEIVEEHSEKISEGVNKEKEEISVVQETNELTKAQRILEEFVMSKVKNGISMNRIENLLDSGLNSGYYTKKDVLVVMNDVLSKKLHTEKSSEKIPVEKETFESSKETIPEGLEISKDEKNFLNFLISNPNHQLSTVELYSSVGLSSRKGNIVKKKLLEKNLIQITEERNENGWKKIIRPSQNIHHL